MGSTNEHQTRMSTVLSTRCWHPMYLVLARTLYNAPHQPAAALWGSKSFHDEDKRRSCSKTGYVIGGLEISGRFQKQEGEVFFITMSTCDDVRDLVLQLYVHSSSTAPIPAQLSSAFSHNKVADSVTAKLRNTQVPSETT